MDISLHAEKLAVRTPFTRQYDLVQCFRGVRSGQLDYNCPVDFLSAGLQRSNEADIWHTDIVLALCTDESAPLIINGEAIASNHGHPCGVAAESPGHGKTVADVGSLWQDAAGIKWSLLRIMSEDRLLFVSENIGKSETDYAFADKIEGELYYEGNRADYRNSINRLRKETVDIFIGNHVWNNDTEVKGLHLLETGENLFIDGELWGRFLDFCEARLDGIIKNEK